MLVAYIKIKMGVVETKHGIGAFLSQPIRPEASKDIYLLIFESFEILLIAISAIIEFPTAHFSTLSSQFSQTRLRYVSSSLYIS